MTKIKVVRVKDIKKTKKEVFNFETPWEQGYFTAIKNCLSKAIEVDLLEEPDYEKTIDHLSGMNVLFEAYDGCIEVPRDLYGKRVKIKIWEIKDEGENK